MNKYRFLVGIVIVVGLVILAAAIALGKVQEATSFGLTGIIAVIGKLALDFSAWAFRMDKNADDSPPPSPQKALPLSSSPKSPIPPAPGAQGVE
jgi:hypothetical protein